jgi:hypothetical protein
MVEVKFKWANHTSPPHHRSVALAAGGSAQPGSNAGTTTHPRWPDSLAPSLSSTYAGPAGTAQHAGATAPGAGGSAHRWNWPYWVSLI